MARFTRPVWLVIALTLCALGLRLWGVTFGLPYEYHIDEHFYYPHAWQMGLGNFDLPDQSHGPSLYLGVLLIAQKIAQLLSRPDFTPIQFAESIVNDPWPVLLAGRVLSALAGALTIPIVFVLARRYRGDVVGVAAAAIMAVVFFHVRDSHFGVPDAVMVLFAALTGWCALRAFDTGRGFDFALAGFFAGQTAAAKYTSALVFVPVLLAAFLIAPRGRARRTAFAAAGLIVGFVSGYPNVLLRPDVFVTDITFLSARVGEGFEGWRLLPDESWQYYLYTLSWGVGVPMLIASALGLIGIAYRRSIKGLILISFPVTYFILMSLSRGHFGRYMLPIVPFLAVPAADVCLIGLPALVRRASARPRVSAPAGIIALSLIVAPNLINSLRADWIMAQPDTRTQAKHWIEANIAAGSRIAVEWPYHTPPLSNGYEVPPASRREYWIDRVWGFGLADRPIEQYQTDGTQIIVSTSFIQRIPAADEAQEANRARFYAQLPQVFREIARFNPTCDGAAPEFTFDSIYGPAIGLWNLCAAGPVITLYQVRP